MKQTATILNFPTRIEKEEELLTNSEKAFIGKMNVINYLNEIASGKYILSENDKQKIRDINGLLYEEGYLLIDVDLSQY